MEAFIEDLREALVEDLKNKDPRVRRAAAWTLGRIGGPKAVEALVGALKDENGAVRLFAVEALGKIGDPQAVEPLIEALKDGEADVRWNAAEALGKIGDPQAVEPLIEALKDGDNDIYFRGCVAGALVNIDPGWRESDIVKNAVFDLISRLENECFSIREAAAWALGRIRDPRAVEPLIEALRDSSIRDTVTEALKKITGKDFGLNTLKWRQWFEENRSKE